VDIRKPTHLSYKNQVMKFVIQQERRNCTDRRSSVQWGGTIKIRWEAADLIRPDFKFWKTDLGQFAFCG
jgi:hypothetical protein